MLIKDGLIWWTNDGDKPSIAAAFLDGSDAGIHMRGPTVTDPTGVEEEGGRIFWTNALQDTVARSNLVGGDAEILVHGG